MAFESDAFISYAHLDNQALIEGHNGWVADFHRALGIRLGQLLGKEPHIWRDPKLQGNDYFAETLIERLRRVAVLVPILSPRYVRSEWTQRELKEFWKAATEEGGVRVGDKARVFKVLKTPIPLEMHPEEVRQFLGYEFFRVDPETGRARELDLVFGAEAQRDYWMKLDDLAHDLSALLEVLECGEEETGEPAVGTPVVYLAETTFDLKAEREAIKRDLREHGYTVLPDRALPLTAPELRSVVQEDLARCQLSVHLVGRNYALVPEGGVESLAEIQNHLAFERGQLGSFSHLVWIPSGLNVEDERQREFIDQIRMNPRSQHGSDLLETCLEDLRTVIHSRLKPVRDPKVLPTPGPGVSRLYFIYDQRDQEAALPWEDFLFGQGLEVIRPAFEGDEAEVREYHEENLRLCDAVLIHYGEASECWVRRKLRDVLKSAGYGRTQPMRAVGISVAPPTSAQKERFRSHEAMVIPQFGGFSPGDLLRFVEQVKGHKEAHAG